MKWSHQAVIITSIKKSFSEAIRIRQLCRVSARNDVRAETSNGEKTFKASRWAHLESWQWTYMNCMQTFKHLTHGNSQLVKSRPLLLWLHPDKYGYTPQSQVWKRKQSSSHSNRLDSSCNLAVPSISLQFAYQLGARQILGLPALGLYSLSVAVLFGSFTGWGTNQHIWPWTLKRTSCEE